MPAGDRSNRKWAAVLLGMVAAAIVGAAVVGPNFPPSTEREPSRARPRFLALDADKVHMRVGPGRRYPIRWIYKRRGLPVRLLRSFNNWRRVEDWQGATGWIHVALLSAAARARVVGGEIAVLRSEPEMSARAVALVESGVIAALERCRKAWCRVRTDVYDGWLPRDRLYGAAGAPRDG